MENIQDCPICLDPIEEPFEARCHHLFCRVCIEELLKKQEASCPICRKVDWIRPEDFPIRIKVSRAWNRGIEAGSFSSPWIIGSSCMIARGVLAGQEFYPKLLIGLGVTSCISSTVASVVSSKLHIENPKILIIPHLIAQTIASLAAFFQSYDSALLGAAGYCIGKATPVKSVVAGVVACFYTMTELVDLLYQKTYTHPRSL